jgi:uncharacterized protein (DUF305 family)
MVAASLTYYGSAMTRVPSVVSAALVALATIRCSGVPGDNSVEAGFARDMATHHEQAAEMSFIIRDASRDERLRALAYDIIVTQSAQRGMFMGWLHQWGLPQASDGARMAWMDMAGHAMAHGPMMPGMASDAELDQFRRATGRDAEVLFLQLMIRHHEGGVLMAKALLSQSKREDVSAIVRGIDASQAAEIDLMTGMLDERGAKPYPSLLR